MRLTLALGAVLLSACGVTRGTITTHDGGTTPGADGGTTPDGSTGPTCAIGQWTCANGGTTARQCDGNGGVIAGSDVDCNSMAQPELCVPLIGCAVCTPNALQCDPNNVEQSQVCATDGSAWLNGALCDSSMGQTCNAGTCHDRCNPVELSYLGCEYWPTVTANSQLDPAFDFSVTLANPQSYTVNYTINSGALTSTMSGTLTAGQVKTINLPWVTALNQGYPACFGEQGPMPANDCGPAVSAFAQHGAYHVTSDGPIAAYQFNPLEYRIGTGNNVKFSFTGDASLLLPTRVLTQNYTVVTHDNWTTQGGGSSATLGGFVSIVGVDPAESGTTVTVQLTASVADPMDPTQTLRPGPHMFNLKLGDVVQLVGVAANQDLTGSLITADHAVAVFTGHDCTNMPLSRGACDHLEEQLFPNETWGNHYAVTQLRDRGPTEQYVVRIISQRDGNMLSFDGIATPVECSIALNTGQFCEFETASSFQVSGVQPFLVMQYMIGLGDNAACEVPENGPPPDPADHSCVGDPAMVTEVPVGQFRSSYDFFVPDSYTLSFMNVVAPTGAQIVMDQTMMINSTPVPVGTGYQVYFVPMTAGSHHIESMDPTVTFGIKVYGVSSYTSYMYPGGLDLAPISPPQ